MVFPLIPLAIGGAAALIGGGLALNAKGRIKKANEKQKAAFDVYQRKSKSFESYKSETDRKLDFLANTRIEGMKAVRQAITFIQRAKLNNPSIISDAEVNMDELTRLEHAYGNILKAVGGMGASAAAGLGIGALTAIGAYGLVGAFGTASTGAAIGGLSGAAASSATLAWFGGGALAAGGLGIAGGMAVLSSVVAAPAVIALGVFGQKKAGDAEKQAEAKIREIKVEEATIERERAKLGQIRSRIEEVSTTVTRLIEELNTALRKAGHNNTNDVYRVVQMAKTLRVALDEPVIEPPRKLTDGLGAKKNEKVSQKEPSKTEIHTNLGRTAKLRPNERIERARYPSEQCADGKMGKRCQNKRTRGYYCPLHGSI